MAPVTSLIWSKCHRSSARVAVTAPCVCGSRLRVSRVARAPRRRAAAAAAIAAAARGAGRRATRCARTRARLRRAEVDLNRLDAGGVAVSSRSAGPGFPAPNAPRAMPRLRTRRPPPPRARGGEAATCSAKNLRGGRHPRPRPPASPRPPPRAPAGAVATAAAVAAAVAATPTPSTDPPFAASHSSAACVPKRAFGGVVGSIGGGARASPPLGGGGGDAIPMVGGSGIGRPNRSEYHARFQNRHGASSAQPTTKARRARETRADKRTGATLNT